MNTTLLRNFLCFTEHMNMTAAARELKLSPSTIFVQLQHLQKTLGKDLYYQTQDGLKLTQAGQELARLQREITEMVGDFKAQIDATCESTSLVFACNANLMVSWVKPILTQLLRYPINLQLKTYEWPLAMEHLQESKVNLVLGECFEIPGGLTFTPLRQCHYCLFGPANQQDRFQQQDISISELASIELVLPSNEIEWRQKLDTICHRQQVSLQVRAEVDVADLIVKLVEQGAGFGILPSYYKLPENFFQLPVSGIPTMQVGWLERPETRNRRTICWLKEELNRYVRSL